MSIICLNSEYITRNRSSYNTGRQCKQNVSSLIQKMKNFKMASAGASSQVICDCDLMSRIVAQSELEWFQG